MPANVNPDIVEILEQEMEHIIELARVKWSSCTSTEGDVEADDVAQQALIKFWLALQKGHVVNPAVYARSIVSSVCIDFKRRHKPVFSLSDERARDLYYAQEQYDPSYSLEQEEALATRVQSATQAVQALPPRQRLAILCSLNDRGDDALPLLNSLESQGIDVETPRWPDAAVDVQLLRASLAVARKKLRSTLNNPSTIE